MAVTALVTENMACYCPGIPAKAPPAMYVRDLPHSGPPPDAQVLAPAGQRTQQSLVIGDASRPKRMTFLRKLPLTGQSRIFS